jgi:vitamin B12 transporter
MSRSREPSARRRALIALSLPLACAAGVPAALGQDEAYGNLPSVVVVATRLPTPADEVASSVTVITGEEIEQKQERTLPDVLADVPGLNVVQTGGPGGTTSVFIRGTNSNEVKILVDGIDVSDPSVVNGAFDFSQMLTSDIERVEVLRGPQSGLYGADAIGGVINIITRAGSGPPHLTAMAEGGSFGTFNQTAGASGSLARFNYAFDAAHFHVDGTPVTPTGVVLPGFPYNNDSYDNVNASTKLGADLTENFDVGLVARYVASTLLTQNTPPEPLSDENGTHQFFTRGTAHLVSFDGRFDQTFGLAYSEFRNRYFDPNFALAFPPNPYIYNGDRVKGDWQGNITVATGQVVTLGAEHQLDRFNSFPFQGGVASSAGYAQLQSNFGERFFDTVSLRYDANEQFGGKATYRVAPAYLIPETGTKLKGTVGTGFHAPTLVELYESFPPFFSANPNLRPETSLGYDAGFEQAALAKRAAFGATWFHNDITNLIEGTATTTVNIGAAVTEGVESFASYKPWDELTFRADYTYTLAEDAVLHTELIRRPKHKASLDATWQATAAATVTATFLYVGPWIDVSRDGLTSGIPVNGYTIANLTGAYDLGHGVTAFARINNLFDRHYQDPLGFERPGLGVFAGVRVALDVAPSPP